MKRVVFGLFRALFPVIAPKVDFHSGRGATVIFRSISCPRAVALTGLTACVLIRRTVRLDRLSRRYLLTVRITRLSPGTARFRPRALTSFETCTGGERLFPRASRRRVHSAEAPRIHYRRYWWAVTHRIWSRAGNRTHALSKGLVARSSLGAAWRSTPGGETRTSLVAGDRWSTVTLFFVHALVTEAR